MRLSLTALVLGAGLALSAASGKPAAALECNDKNPEVCQTCDDLRKAYSGADITTIRSVRGRSVWTPLYAAYFKDCYDLAQSYLQQGTHPAIGGAEGDLLATVIGWDRFEVEERSKWVRLLVQFGAKLDSPPITNRTSRQRVLDEYGQRNDVMQLIAVAEQAGG